MFTPDFWETENKIGNAEYVEEQTRLRELKDFLNTPGMKKEVKHKVLEAQL